MSEGVLLSGTELAAEIRQNLSKELEDIRTNNDSFTPGLVIVQVHYLYNTNQSCNNDLRRFLYFPASLALPKISIDINMI